MPNNRHRPACSVASPHQPASTTTPTMFPFYWPPMPALLCTDTCRLHYHSRTAAHARAHLVRITRSARYWLVLPWTDAVPYRAFVPLESTMDMH